MATKKKKKLTPPDVNQCQAEKPVDTNFMTLGGPSVGTMERCTNKPVCIVTENKPGKDGQVGSMSLCQDCLKQFNKQLGPDYATSKPMKESKRGRTTTRA